MKPSALCPTKWELAQLGDIIEISHGFAFQGEFFRDEPPGDILLTPGNFAVGGGFKADKIKYYAGPIPAEFVLAAGDLLVSMTDLSKQSDTLGYPALVPIAEENVRYLHNQRLGKVVIKDDTLLDKMFLYYLLRTAPYRHEILASATGTTVKHTSPKRIEAFKFLRPPLPEQRVIAKILCSFDDKIELNRRINETLEAIAWAIFKSWFVDFDPVKANIAGRRLTGMDVATAALFPKSFADSDLGEIPKGWRVMPFSETVDIRGGGTPKTSMPGCWDGEVPWFSVVDSPRSADVWVVDTERRITQEGLQNSSAQILPVGTTIISARGTVGRISLVGVPMAMNQSCYGLQGKAAENVLFTYFTTRALVAGLQQRAHGAVFDTITRDTLASLSVAMPPIELIQAFELQVRQKMERIRGSLFESRILAALRDILLPRLLSGSPRIGDASPQSDPMGGAHAGN